MKLNTYLNFGGNCREALEFYAKHLGGIITTMIKQGEMPNAPAAAPEMKGMVLHARIAIAGVEIMASDAPPDRYQPMRSAYLSLGMDSPAEAERIFAVLSEGGEVFMPLQETFFAKRFAMLRDRFGVSWMIMNQRPEDATHA